MELIFEDTAKEAEGNRDEREKTKNQTRNIDTKPDNRGGRKNAHKSMQVRWKKD